MGGGTSPPTSPDLQEALYHRRYFPTYITRLARGTVSQEAFPHLHHLTRKRNHITGGISPLDLRKVPYAVLHPSAGVPSTQPHGWTAPIFCCYTARWLAKTSAVPPEKRLTGGMQRHGCEVRSAGLKPAPALSPFPSKHCTSNRLATDTA
jgi:hypothetical protein